MWMNDTKVASIIIIMHTLFFKCKSYVPMLNCFQSVSPIVPESVLDPRLTLTMKEIEKTRDLSIVLCASAATTNLKI
jgi:hypothetical protein